MANYRGLEHLILAGSPGFGSWMAAGKPAALIENPKNYDDVSGMYDPAGAELSFKRAFHEALILVP